MGPRQGIPPALAGPRPHWDTVPSWQSNAGTCRTNRARQGPVSVGMKGSRAATLLTRGWPAGKPPRWQTKKLPI